MTLTAEVRRIHQPASQARAGRLLSPPRAQWQLQEQRRLETSGGPRQARITHSALPPDCDRDGCIAQWLRNRSQSWHEDERYGKKSDGGSVIATSRAERIKQGNLLGLCSPKRRGSEYLT